ncbi:MAG: hypothetical protein JWM25_1977 [Thermoleophilia bacterium]|nr:hypothetical protein [Thermoleophilia bacterium]
MSHAAAPAAGWYPDPQATDQLRWWDGMQWGHQTAPAQAPAAQPALHAVATSAAVATPADPALSFTSAPTQVTAGPVGDARYQHDRFVVVQKLRPMVNRYEVRTAADFEAEPAPGGLVALVQQKRMALKSKVTFYADEAKTEPLLELQGKNALDFGGGYPLRDHATGQPIGLLKKRIGASMFVSSTWDVTDLAGNLVATVTEANMALALLRRYVGGLIAMLPYAFTISAGTGAAAYGVPAGAVLGTYTRRWGIRDTYDLDLSGDPARIIDRRLAVALTIALDAFEGR